MAMLPARSSAMLGIKRFVTFAPSGSHVVACGSEAAMVPPVTLTWYQRGAACPDGLCRRSGGRHVEGDQFGRGADGIDRSLVEGAGACGFERRAGAEGEHVRRHVEAIGPDADLRIVVEGVADLDGVKVPSAADRIAVHGDA